jgi:hypothetical protein
LPSLQKNKKVPALIGRGTSLLLPVEFIRLFIIDILIFYHPFIKKAGVEIKICKKKRAMNKCQPRVIS